MTSIKHHSDFELLLGRGADTFAEVYRRHVDVVLRHCARLGLSPQDAADVTSETFAAALAARHRYRDDNSTAAPWLLTIASRRASDRRRRFSREQRACRRLHIQQINVTAEDVADYDVMLETESKAVAEQLARLAPSQREAIIARVIDEREYHEISSATELAEPAVRQRVHRGLALLRQRLTEPS